MGCIARSGYAARVDVRSLAHTASGGDDRIADSAVVARGGAVHVEIERSIDTRLRTAWREQASGSDEQEASHYERHVHATTSGSKDALANRP